MTSSSKGSVAGYGNYLLREEKTEITLIETKSCTTDFVRDFAITKNLNGKTDGVQFHEIVGGWPELFTKSATYCYNP